MIDERVLDELIPVPELDELKEQIYEEFEREGFAITNKRAGGIFTTLIMIILKCHVELKKLARTILKNIFLDSAEGLWIELIAGDFSKERKIESKTEGKITLSRTERGEALTITKGTVFKTDQDANGEELKYITTEQTILQVNSTSVQVPVVAELAGSIYNVATNQITKCLINLEGINAITNECGWIIKEGSDIEDLESLKSRTKLSWSELATLPIADKYKNICESVEGVFLAEVDDQHPRGQGTVDIYITSSAGAASSNLLILVSAAVDTIKGPYDNVLVKSTNTVEQNVTVTIDIPSTESTVGIKAKAEDIIKELLSIKAGKRLNLLTHTDIIHDIKSAIPMIKAVTVSIPAADVELSKGNILVAGNIAITVRQV